MTTRSWFRKLFARAVRRPLTPRRGQLHPDRRQRLRHHRAGAADGHGQRRDDHPGGGVPGVHRRLQRLRARPRPRRPERHPDVQHDGAEQHHARHLRHHAVQPEFQQLHHHLPAGQADHPQLRPGDDQPPDRAGRRGHRRPGVGPAELAGYPVAGGHHRLRRGRHGRRRRPAGGVHQPRQRPAGQADRRRPGRRQDGLRPEDHRRGGVRRSVAVPAAQAAFADVDKVKGFLAHSGT